MKACSMMPFNFHLFEKAKKNFHTSIIHVCLSFLSRYILSLEACFGYNYAFFFLVDCWGYRELLSGGPWTALPEYFFDA